MINRRLFAVIFTFAVIAPRCVQASTTVPDTQDAFVYKFLSTSTGTSLSGFFPGIIAVANADPHSVNSLVLFGDLGTRGISASQVSTATLTMTVASGPGFGPGPTPAAEVIVDLYAANAAWSSGTVTWNNQPVATGLGLLGQETSDGSQSALTFDVTSLVQGWLDGSVTNNGFILTQANAGSQSLAFNSVSSASGGPFLTINTVPEPSSLALAGLGLGAIVIGAVRHGRRRAAVR